jgi:hypothetical protein
MTQSADGARGADLSQLLSDFLHNSEKLIDLQFRVARREIADEVRKAGTAAVLVGAGAGLLAVGGVFASETAVHLLRRATGLPLWACYGIAAGAAGAAGAGLVRAGSRRAAALQLPALPQTAAALKENLSWLKEQATTDAP